MPLSTSSSSSLNKVTPRQPWGKLALISLFGAMVLTIGWEFFWRSKGYMPTLNDNKDTWALIREKVEMEPERTVLIGSSRMLFDFNLDVWKKKFDETPLQLATVGTNASVYLDEIANYSQFKGTLLVGITPPLFFVPQGQPMQTPKDNIKHFRRFSPAQKISHHLGLPLERVFAFIEQEDIPLSKLLKILPIENRKNVQLSPQLPPYFMELDSRRQGMMIRKMETDVAFQKRIQNIWIPLFTPPPVPPIFTAEQFKKMFADHVNGVLDKAKKDISKIQSRGGRVILVRFPSTGKVRELENKFAPRVGFWDRIVNETHPDKAIHFEDHPQLKKYDCPEWSHLTRADAASFTRELIGLL